jgi:hypothetical protein
VNGLADGVPVCTRVVRMPPIWRGVRHVLRAFSLLACLAAALAWVVSYRYLALVIYEGRDGRSGGRSIHMLR